MPKKKNEQISFTISPGTKIQITVQAGEANDDGNLPITVNVEQVAAEVIQQPEKMPLVSPGRLRVRVEAFLNRLKSYDIAVFLFIAAIAVYLLTRLIGLTHFPIYFFTDEAIQTQSIADLIKNGYKAESIFFPTYFRNGEYLNLSLSVYLQWLPLILFGKSALVTRATSVFVTLIAAFSVGIILRDVFKAKYWWVGTLFLSITPAWFLHSRTAFETAEFSSFYAGTLCAYLLYRYKSDRYLYLALFLGALAFYSYNPAQLIIPATAIALLISDWRYHWEHRITALQGLVLLVIFSLPYVRFRIENPDAAISHLHVLGSYLVENIPLSEKIRRYFSEYSIGLGAWYWYSPNERDLGRHLMKGYGHIMAITLPFAILGLAKVLRHLRESAYRTILVVMLVSPISGALVQTSITRVLMFVIPVVILTSIGFEQFLLWIENPAERLTGLAAGLGLTRKRSLLTLFIIFAGSLIAYLCKNSLDQDAVLALMVILALQVSGVIEQLAKKLMTSNRASSLKGWHLPQILIALIVFATLVGMNFNMLNDALKNGPLWYKDYGMGGMQYGAFQIFDAIQQYKIEYPESRIILSPSWANGTDVVIRFFLNDPLPIGVGSIQGHIDKKLPLDDNTVFVMIPEEYSTLKNQEKFTDIRVEKIVPYPDGKPGFYFVRLRYVDNIDQIFAAEEELRLALQEKVVKIDGQDVKVRYSFLETNAIEQVFDGDPYTFMKTLEANPFVIEMTFPSEKIIKGFSIIIGSVNAKITLKCYTTPDAEPIIYVFEGKGTVDQPELSFDLPKSTPVQVLRVEMLDPYSPSPTNVHIWELKLR